MGTPIDICQDQIKKRWTEFGAYVMRGVEYEMKYGHQHRSIFYEGNKNKHKRFIGGDTEEVVGVELDEKWNCRLGGTDVEGMTFTSSLSGAVLLYAHINIEDPRVQHYFGGSFCRYKSVWLDYGTRQARRYFVWYSKLAVKKIETPSPTKKRKIEGDENWWVKKTNMYMYLCMYVTNPFDLQSY